MHAVSPVSGMWSAPSGPERDVGTTVEASPIGPGHVPLAPCERLRAASFVETDAATAIATAVNPARVTELRAEVAELRAMITAVRAPADGDGLKHPGVGLANGGSPTPSACDCSGRVFLPPDDAFEPGVGLGRDPAARPSDEVRGCAIPTDSKIYVVCRGAAGAVRKVAGVYVSYVSYVLANEAP